MLIAWLVGSLIGGMSPQKRNELESRLEKLRLQTRHVEQLEAVRLIADACSFVNEFSLTTPASDFLEKFNSRAGQEYRLSVDDEKAVKVAIRARNNLLRALDLLETLRNHLSDEATFPLPRNVDSTLKEMLDSLSGVRKEVKPIEAVYAKLLNHQRFGDVVRVASSYLAEIPDGFVKARMTEVLRSSQKRFWSGTDRTEVEEASRDLESSIPSFRDWRTAHALAVEAAAANAAETAAASAVAASAEASRRARIIEKQQLQSLQAKRAAEEAETLMKASARTLVERKTRELERRLALEAELCRKAIAAAAAEPRNVQRKRRNETVEPLSNVLTDVTPDVRFIDYLFQKFESLLLLTGRIRVCVRCVFLGLCWSLVFNFLPVFPVEGQCSSSSIGSQLRQVFIPLFLTEITIDVLHLLMGTKQDYDDAVEISCQEMSHRLSVLAYYYRTGGIKNFVSLFNGSITGRFCPIGNFHWLVRMVQVFARSTGRILVLVDELLASRLGIERLVSDIPQFHVGLSGIFGAVTLVAVVWTRVRILSCIRLDLLRGSSRGAMPKALSNMSRIIRIFSIAPYYMRLAQIRRGDLPVEARERLDRLLGND